MADYRIVFAGLLIALVLFALTVAPTAWQVRRKGRGPLYGCVAWLCVFIAFGAAAMIVLSPLGRSKYLTFFAIGLLLLIALGGAFAMKSALDWPSRRRWIAIGFPLAVWTWFLGILTFDSVRYLVLGGLGY